MASKDPKATTTEVPELSEQEQLFQQGLKEMLVDEALFEEEPPPVEEESAEESVEEAQAFSEASDEAALPSSKQAAIDQALSIFDEATEPASADPDPASDDSAPTPPEVSAPVDPASAANALSDEETTVSTEPKGHLDPSEYLGPGSDLDAYFEDASEEDDPHFTEEDLADLPLFDDMDDDDLGLDGPAPAVVAPPPEPAKKKGKTKAKKTKKVKAPKTAEDEPDHPEGLTLSLPSWMGSLGTKRALLITIAAAGLVAATVGLTMLLSSGSDGAAEVDAETGTVAAEEGPKAAEGVAEEGSSAYEDVPPAEDVLPPGTEEAIRNRTAPRPGPDLTDNHHALGMAYFKAGRYADAVAEFENGITSSHILLARCYQLLGENEAALAQYQRVLWEYPDRNAFVEIFSLAEEMFATRDYPAARKLYYAFVAQTDRMPEPVRALVPKAYFKIGRCLEEEAFALLDGIPMTAGAALPGSIDPREIDEDAADEGLPPVSRRPGMPDRSALPARIRVEAHRENDLNTLFTVECIAAPAHRVFDALAREAGRRLNLEGNLPDRIDDEVVSAFLKNRNLEEILEYLAGQIGLTFELDGATLSLKPLEAKVAGDWLNLKDEALRAFRRNLYRFMGHEDAPKIYFEISRLHYLSGDFDAAIEPADNLIVNYPGFSQLPMALLNVAKCYMELGDYRKARTKLRELVNKHGGHPAAQEGFLLLARCTWKAGNPAEAMLTLESMAQRFPDSPHLIEGQVILARILCSLGEPVQATRILCDIDLDAVDTDDDRDRILMLKSEAFIEAGDPGAAVAAAMEMLERRPGSPNEKGALHLMAKGYASMDEPVMAFATCKTLKEKYPAAQEDPDLYLTAARSLMAMDLPRTALEWLEEGVARCPEGTKDTFAMILLLGDVLRDLQKHERAKAVYRRLREEPDLRDDVNVRIIRCQMAQRNYREALDTIRDLLPGSGRDPAFERGLFKMAGDCFLALDDTESAIRAYRGEFENVLPGGEE